MNLKFYPVHWMEEHLVHRLHSLSATRIINQVTTIATRTCTGPLMQTIHTKRNTVCATIVAGADRRLVKLLPGFFAGAVAKLILKQCAMGSAGKKISIHAYVSQVGPVKLEKKYSELDLNKTESNSVRCPDDGSAMKMIECIERVRSEGETTGGVVTCVIQHIPAGLGEPVFDKLNADLAKAMMSINAAHGFEYGSGFEGAGMKGSEHNDLFTEVQEAGPTKKFVTGTNHSGGIQGGISNGMDVYFRVAFKPVSTVMKPQQTLNTKGEAVVLIGKGRHDPCVVPRAVPIVEAMAAIVLADHFLRNKSSKIESLIDQSL